MLMAMDMLLAMVMGCRSPCELWDLDALHHATMLMGTAMPSPGSLMVMLMLRLKRYSAGADASSNGTAPGNAKAIGTPFTLDPQQCYVGP